MNSYAVAHRNAFEGGLKNFLQGRVAAAHEEVPPPAKLAPTGLASKKPKQDLQSNRWCFTIFPDAIAMTLDDQRYLVSEIMESLAELCVWMIAGLETCPTTGRQHLQCFALFEGRHRFTELKKFHPSIHWEKAKGDNQSQWDYCTKEDKDPSVWGTRPEEPKDKAARTRESYDNTLRELRSDGVLAVSNSQHLIQHFTNLQKIETFVRPAAEDLEDVCGYWFYGVPASGKSRYARKMLFLNEDERKDLKVYLKNCNNKWWCGYSGQDVVIMEDMDRTHKYMSHYLKLWTDKYPFQAEWKSGGGVFRPKYIVVTSNHSIDDIFGGNGLTEDEKLDLLALKRRFKQVCYFPYRWTPDRATVMQVNEEIIEPKPLEREETVILPTPPKLTRQVGMCDITTSFRYPTPRFNKPPTEVIHIIDSDEEE